MKKWCLKCYQEYETEEEYCPRCHSQLGIPNGSGGYIFRATAITKEVPSMERAQLVCTIPEGRVATEDDLQAFFCRRYNADSIRFAPPSPLYAKRVAGRLKPILFPESDDDVELIPNWRVVSQRGFVDERNIDKLKAEGLQVVQSGRGWRIPNYKEKKISFDRLLTLVIDSAPVWPF